MCAAAPTGLGFSRVAPRAVCAGVRARINFSSLYNSTVIPCSHRRTAPCRRGKYVYHRTTSPPPPTTFFRAAPEPGVIAGDKDPPRYEPSLRDLPPVGPSIRGCLLLVLHLLHRRHHHRHHRHFSFPLPPPDTLSSVASSVGLLAYSRWIFTSDVYERR